MGSKAGNILKKAAGVVLPNLGFAGGFANGLIQGDGIGGALKQGVGSGIQTAAGMAGAPLGSALGVSSGLGGALAGGVGGLANSALNGGNPLTGALGGAAGGYLSNGGLGGLSGSLDDTALGRGLQDTWAGDALGVTPSFNKIISTPISTNAGGGASSFLGGSASSFGGNNALSSILSAGLGTSANDDAEKELLRAQQQGLGAITPFSNTQFTGEDLQNDPGYQFQLQQGEQALARSQAARGNLFSGSALKAAQDYGQGLAGTSFDNANNRYANNRNFNYGVAQDQAGIYGNQGNIKANAGVSNSNLLSGALSGVLGGNGINNQGQPLGRPILGYNPQTGEPIYG